MKNNNSGCDRRGFLDALALAAGGVMVSILSGPGPAPAEAGVPEPGAPEYEWRRHRYAYLIDTRKCIGCGLCVKACKEENQVPDNFFRTWVERYLISETGESYVDSPNGGLDGFPPVITGFQVSKAFFVPKMCNHCRSSPCVQVCPVGASYETVDGAVLVDPAHCIGCSYCVQACPYGCRFINPASQTADKCTWCYHRIVKGLLPACVQVCPVGARRFSDLKKEGDPVRQIIARERVMVLQPDLLTKPSCFYLGLDREVR